VPRGSTGTTGKGSYVMLRLVKVQHEMPYAVAVRTLDDSRYGTLFEFVDRSGKVHGQYQFGNVSQPPENTLGAIRESDRSWWWVIRDAEPVRESK
jgi:hypothetical protein